MVRVKSVPKKYIPKPKPRLMGRGKSKQKSRYNLRPIPSRAALAESTPEPDSSLASEAQQAASIQASTQPDANTSPVAALLATAVVKKGPVKHIDENQLKCLLPGCSYTTRRHNLRAEHMEKHSCDKCGEEFLDLKSEHTDCPNAGEVGCFGPQHYDVKSQVFKESKRAHRGTIMYYMHSPDSKICMIADFINSVKEELIDLLKQLIKFFKSFRLRLVICVDLYEIGHDFVFENVYLKSIWPLLTHNNFIDNAVFQCAAHLIDQLNTWSERKSSWEILRCKSLEVHVGQVEFGRGRGYIQIPKALSYRQGFINIKSKGNNCFQLCIMAAVHSDRILSDYIDRRTKEGTMPQYGTPAYSNAIKQKLTGARQYEQLLRENAIGIYGDETINFSGLNEAGPDLQFMDIFEANNINVSVTVFGNFGSEIQPIRNTNKVRAMHINLLLLYDESSTNSHYVLINNISKTQGKRDRKAHVFCHLCNRGYNSKAALYKHMNLCGMGSDSTQIRKPPSEQYKRFTDWYMTLPMPYCLYYEFHFVTKDEISTPQGYSLVLITPKGYKDLEYYIGDDAITHFLSRALELAEKTVRKVSETNLPVEATEEQMQLFHAAKKCDFCLKPFHASDPKVLHHNHHLGTISSYQGPPNDTSGIFTGITGAAHNSCNLQVKVKEYLMAISSSGNDEFYKRILLEGHEANILVESCTKPLFDKRNKIIGLKLNNVLRLNSLSNHKKETLETLAVQTLESGGEFQNLNWFLFKHRHLVPIILKQDYIFPTRYSLEELDQIQATSLTTYLRREYFNSEKECSNEQYSTYRILKRELNFKTVSKYFEYYLKLKCLTLADVFEHYRKYNLNTTGLDLISAWTYGSFSFNCALYKNRVEIEYLTDPGMNEMCDKLIKGGVTVLTKQISESNSDRSPDYDQNKIRSEILEIDRILSYGTCCMELLPIGEFEWMSESELEQFNYANPPIDTGIGFYFECTLTLDPEFHFKYKDFPLWPDKREITIRSDSQQSSSDFCKGMGRTTTRTLLTLLDKVDDCFYYKSLKFLLNHDYRLINVKRGFKCKEKRFLEPYIRYHVEKRQQAACELDRAWHKDLVNVVFGKTLSDGLSYPECKLCFSSVKCKELLRRDKFQNVEIIGENMSCFQFTKATGTDAHIRLVGATILELAKLALYEQYYDVIKAQFPDCSLLASNTDSLLIKINDWELDYFDRLRAIQHTFDFSNLPESHELYSTHNIAKPGFWKLTHFNIKEFVGTRVASCSLKYGDTEYQCKGVNKLKLRDEQRHSILKNSVLDFEKKRTRVNSVEIGTKGQIIVSVNKLSYYSIDCTRLWLSPRFSVPIGYKGPMPEENMVKYMV